MFTRIVSPHSETPQIWRRLCGGGMSKILVAPLCLKLGMYCSAGPWQVRGALGRTRNTNNTQFYLTIRQRLNNKDNSATNTWSRLEICTKQHELFDEEHREKVYRVTLLNDAWEAFIASLASRSWLAALMRIACSARPEAWNLHSLHPAGFLGAILRLMSDFV